ncbi:hypothetical protein KWI12_02695 [Citrobacter cronae]|uniref:hypothetical protein n=1 Tax=Citrobacter cronae TaxID=1748967 RepID=UPI0021CEDDC0|nr:hypothetical protein [Citrobacter cronae]MCU6195755.1 hypothetical protein [Citrobacter cronae]
MFHIGTLNHKNNKVCDPDPFLYREITDQHEDQFPQLRATLRKNPQKKAGRAVWPALIAEEKSRASSHCADFSPN